MRRLGFLHAFGLLVLLAPAGCTSEAAGDGDDADVGESDLKKKVKPKGGNGALDLMKPSWSTTAAVGGYVFDRGSIALGSRTEKTAGTYLLETVGSNFEDGTMMSQRFGSVVISPGVVEQRTATGLRVRFAQPITLGASRVELTPIDGGSRGSLNARAPWQGRDGGALMFVAPGTLDVRSAAAGATGWQVVLTEGKLTEVVLPVAKIAVQLDAYDPAYPTPPASTCAPPYIVGGALGYKDTRFVRDANGSAVPAVVIPQGAQATADLVVYEMKKSVPTVADGTTTFALNRLEVDDVEVTLAGGATQTVRGTYSVEYKDGAEYRSLGCTFPTHTGIDLPDGVYRITSRAQATSGAITHVEEVSFP